MATKEKVIKTPYDREIAKLREEKELGNNGGWRPDIDGSYLWTLLGKREGWLEGYPTGFEAGIEEVEANPELYGLAAPTKGSTV